MPLTDSFLDGPLGAFLRSREAERGGSPSLTGMGTIKGRWTIRDEEYPQFLDLLHEYLFIQKRRPLNLVEQRRSDYVSPILIDLDFKYPSESAIERRFTISDIHSFIRSFISELKHFYNIESMESPLRFFISLRPAPYEDKRSSSNRTIKDGAHIECPDLPLLNDHQRIIRQKLLNQNSISGHFGHTGFINSEHDIYDEAMVKKAGWFYYGESKPDIPAYNLCSVYSYYPSSGKYEEESITNYSTRQLIEILSIRYNLKMKPVHIHPEVIDEWNMLLKNIQTISGGNDEMPGVDLQIKNTNIAEKAAEIMPTWLSTGYTPQEVELAKTLVDRCLSSERATSYQSWMEVAWCLHSIDQSEDMFNVWIQFSEKSSKSSQNNLRNLWKEWASGWRRRDNDRKFTIRSLHFWAKNDNPEEYKKIIDLDALHFIETYVDATHTHVARLMQKLYWGEYRASVSSKNTEWFEFKDNCWKKLNQGLEIRNKMTTEVSELVNQTRQAMKKRLDNSTNIDERYKEACFKRLLQIEKSLYSAGFKDSVMKECVCLFYEEDFAQKLNSNPFLLGCANGVINLRSEINGKYYVEFRKGKPEDYNSFMIGRWLPKQCDPFDYIPYNPEDPEQAEIDDFMEKVFPRPELRAYMWRKLASCLEGTNREQTYETWIGVGGNGKSKLTDLMAMTLGDYATSLQSTVLTRKRPESGAANPDLMAIRNRRFIYMQEPDDGEPLNTSRMKQFTGEDVVEARGLFEDQTKFQITGKMFMMCNRFPPIHAMDRGTWRRVRATPFESKFVDPDGDEGKDISPQNKIFPRDNQLDIKLKRWRSFFFARLVHIYENEYMKNGLEPIPAIIKQESEKYREGFDGFGKFKNARIRIESGSEARILDIWRAYKNWLEISGSGSGKKLTQLELQKRLEDEFGVPQDKKTFKRIHVFDSDEDVEEFDAERALSKA
jgi:P4 family phage/plasmid primase-like protien